MYIYVRYVFDKVIVFNICYILLHSCIHIFKSHVRTEFHNFYDLGLSSFLYNILGSYVQGLVLFDRQSIWKNQVCTNENDDSRSGVYIFA